LSLTSPLGLSREWDDPYPALFAKEYSLKTLELNPSAAYALNRFISIGGGLRLVYGEAEVENGGSLLKTMAAPVCSSGNRPTCYAVRLAATLTN
jgi:long-subunit fatty acid transport protein